jgi:hypothetical protein
VILGEQFPKFQRIVFPLSPDRSKRRKLLKKQRNIPEGGPGSVVGIATGYWLDGLWIESRWGRDFPHLSRPALGPIQPHVKWVPGLSWSKERPGRDADPSPLSSVVVMKK